MHGLRKINNTYTPDGTGRDLLIYYDPAFRGGKAFSDTFSPHLPKPEAGDVKLSRPPKTGYNARIEYSAQHLNLARSASDRTLAMKRKHADPFASRLQALQMASTTSANQTFFRSKSDPALLGSCPFRRSVGAFHGASAVYLPKPQAIDLSGFGGSGSPTKKQEIWAEPGERHQYMGFSRTAYGGLWKAMSATGPG